MAFRLLNNEKFPLRTVNLIKKYLETGGSVQIGNRIAGQLSKLQLIDFFFPSLFVRELPASAEDAEYDFKTCFIMAPRKHGVLSSWGPAKQKINEMEDCLLGNSRSEKTYKNYIAAHSMLRRAASELAADEHAFRALFSNLCGIYNSLENSEKKEMNLWLANFMAGCMNEETVLFCTASRTDGLSFERDVYERLLQSADHLYKTAEYAGCFAWLCIGSLLGNYSTALMNRYIRSAYDGAVTSDPDMPRLISSPSVIAKPGFCGRDYELRKIDELFDAGNRVVFLSGIGGIGKTEIARQYAAVSKTKYDVIVYSVYDRSLQDLIIADIPFETIPAIPRLIADRARESDEAYFRRKLSLIRKKADERTLIILDNFNTESDPAFYELLSGRWRVLITSQYDYSKEFASIRIKEISDMDFLRDIFMNHYQGYAVERDDPDLERLFQAVSCHTYTVVLLAHHMENSGQTAGEMLKELEEKGIASLNETVTVREGDSDIAWQNLARMFSLSEFSEEEKKILQLLSMISTGGIPPMEFMKWADLSSTRSILALERRGWLMRTQGGITLHPVIGSIVRYYLGAGSEDINLFLDRFADYISEKNSWHFTKLQKEQACMICRNIMNLIGELNENTIKFYQAASALYGYSGFPERSIDLSERLFRYLCETKELNTPETGRAAYRIGWVYLFTPQLPGSIDNALQWLHKAAEIFESTPMDTVDLQAIYCGILENISKAYSFQHELTGSKRDIAEALRYAKKAVALSRGWLYDYTRTKRSPAGSLLRLADVKMDLMDYEEAHDLIAEAYTILVSMYGTNDPDVLRASSRKGIVLFYLGRYKEALETVEDNLVSYLKFYGTDNPSLLDQLILKVRCCRRLGRSDLAARTAKEVLETGKKIYSPDSKKMQEITALISEEY